MAEEASQGIGNGKKRSLLPKLGKGRKAKFYLLSPEGSGRSVRNGKRKENCSTCLYAGVTRKRGRANTHSAVPLQKKRKDSVEPFQTRLQRDKKRKSRNHP